MAITVPALPRFSQARISMSSNPWVLRPTFGGPDQRLSRVGSERFTVAVTCQGMSQDQGSEIVAAVSQGQLQLLRLTLPQQGKALPSNGTVVSGSGTSLSVSGTSPKPGQYVTLTDGTYYYLHQVATASGGSLTLTTPLKAAVTGTANFAAPFIEGYLVENSLDYEFGLTGVIKLTFAVSEAR